MQMEMELAMGRSWHVVIGEGFTTALTYEVAHQILLTSVIVIVSCTVTVNVIVRYFSMDERVALKDQDL